MARITAEERQRRLEMYNDKIWEIFINEGWEYVTYDRLAKEFGIRKSTLQHYYSSANKFHTALADKVYPEVYPRLNFSSKDSFIKSWSDLYKSERMFQEVVDSLIKVVMKYGADEQAVTLTSRVERALAQEIGLEDAQECIKIVYGETIFNKLFP